MKISKVLKKKFIVFSLLITVLIICSNPVWAQQYSIKDRWNIKLDCVGYQSLGFELNAYTPSFQSELNYGILNFFEIGSYLGYGKVRTRSTLTSSGAVNVDRTNTFFYGINTNVHILPFLISSEKFRFDLYASGKLGGFYRFSKEGMYPDRVHEWDYGMYLGAAYYLGRHLGFFCEYGIGNYTNHRFGVSLKF